MIIHIVTKYNNHKQTSNTVMLFYSYQMQEDEMAIENMRWCIHVSLIKMNIDSLSTIRIFKDLILSPPTTLVLKKWIHFYEIPMYFHAN